MHSVLAAGRPWLVERLVSLVQVTHQVPETRSIPIDRGPSEHGNLFGSQSVLGSET